MKARFAKFLIGLGIIKIQNQLTTLAWKVFRHNYLYKKINDWFLNFGSFVNKHLTSVLIHLKCNKIVNFVEKLYNCLCSCIRCYFSHLCVN